MNWKIINLIFVILILSSFTYAVNNPATIIVPFSIPIDVTLENNPDANLIKIDEPARVFTLTESTSDNTIFNYTTQILPEGDYNFTIIATGINGESSGLLHSSFTIDASSFIHNLLNIYLIIY